MVTKYLGYGGLIETMYSQFPEEEIPQEIRKYKERIDELLSCKTMKEYNTRVKSFSEYEMNYLGSSIVDNCSEISKAYIAFRRRKK